jgi:hypothetical protein
MVLAAASTPALCMSFGIGPKAGINLGSADADDVDDMERRLGLGLGLQAEFGVTRPYSLVLEPQYLQKGARFDVLALQVEGDFDYLEVPILFKAKLGRLGGHAYVFAGPAVGILLDVEGRVAEFSNDFEDEASRFTISGEVGAGGAFQMQKYVFLSADVRYSHGFNDALESDVGGIDSWHSRDIRIMFGVLFHLTE